MAHSAEYNRLKHTRYDLTVRQCRCGTPLIGGRVCIGCQQEQQRTNSLFEKSDVRQDIAQQNDEEQLQAVAAFSLIEHEDL